MLTLSSGTTRVVVDPDRGGRLTSLHVDGHQLILPANPAALPIHGGCFPMVPWAGRVRDGRFTFAGVKVQLHRDAPPNAIHGVAYHRPWTVVAQRDDRVELAISLSTPAVRAAGWPFGGRVTQVITATADGVALEMAVTAQAVDLPLTLGWHPWFVRHLEGVEGHADFSAEAMYQRDDDGLPTGALVPVPAGPYDDCMTGLIGTPAVVWPGIGRIEVASDLDHLVVFTAHTHGICIEPQSGPPDAVNLPEPDVLPARQTMTGRMELCWRAG